MSGNQDGEIELITDRAALHYVARTLDGPGASNETWTSLDPVSEHRTGIRVEFCAPPIEEESLRQFGNGMIGLYTLLWNQDEEMMRTRTRALADRDSGDSSWQRPATPAETIPLGSIEAFRARLPFSIEAQGHAYRIIETEGEFVAHSTQCPHRLGPLENCEVHDGVIACPWHGYTFDVRSGRSGRSADGHSLRLRPAPRIEIDEAADSVVATFAKGERDRVQVEADHESS
jgi:nitrite reductase/ring-hydroxylating ferredoxin subunit